MLNNDMSPDSFVVIMDNMDKVAVESTCRYGIFLDENERRREFGVLAECGLSARARARTHAAERGRS